MAPPDMDVVIVGAGVSETMWTAAALMFWDENRRSMSPYDHPLLYQLELDFSAALQSEGIVYVASKHLSAEPG